MQLKKDSIEWKRRHACWQILQNPDLWNCFKEQMIEDATAPLQPIEDLNTIIAMVNRSAQIDYVDYFIKRVERFSKEFETVVEVLEEES